MKRVALVLLLFVAASPEAWAGWYHNGCFNCRSSGLSLECWEVMDDGQTGQTTCYEELGVLYWDCFTEGTACMNVIATGGGGGGCAGGGGGSSCNVSGTAWCPASCFYCTRELF